MPISRREALRELSALFAIPLIRWPERLADPGVDLRSLLTQAPSGPPRA